MEPVGAPGAIAATPHRREPAKTSQTVALGCDQWPIALRRKEESLAGLIEAERGALSK